MQLDPQIPPFNEEDAIHELILSGDEDELFDW